MPERFLLQILRGLVMRGILTSTRGVDGGYSLTRTPDQISLLEIVEAIDGPMDPNRAETPAGVSPKLEAAMNRVTTVLRNELAGIRLSQLLPSRS